MEIKVTSRKYSWATALHGTMPKLVYSHWCVNSLESKGAELVTSKFDLLVTRKWKSFCTQFSTSAHDQSFSVVLMSPLFSQEKKLTLIHFNAFLHLKRNSSFNMVLFNLVNKPFNDLRQWEILYGQATQPQISCNNPNFSDASQRCKEPLEEKCFSCNLPCIYSWEELWQYIIFFKSWHLDILEWHNSSPPRFYHNYKLVQFE